MKCILKTKARNQRRKISSGISNINKIPSNFHLVKEIVLPLNSFMSKGAAFKEVPTVFQV